MQYRDGLLPLTTIGGWYDNHERPVVTVLHTSYGEIGLVVDRVLDVAKRQRSRRHHHRHRRTSARDRRRRATHPLCRHLLVENHR
ncbi:MAG: hypothetical protein R2713_09565 [Ilumatobacteraceae bacterium]